MGSSLIGSFHLVGNCPVPAHIRIRKDPIERDHQGDPQVRVTEGIVGDLVDAVQKCIDHGERQTIELVAGEISEPWVEGHGAAGTLRP